MDTVILFFALMSWAWVITIALASLIGMWCGFVILFWKDKEIENG